MTNQLNAENKFEFFIAYSPKEKKYIWFEKFVRYLQQMGAGSKPFSFGEEYRCDVATGKWVWI